MTCQEVMEYMQRQLDGDLDEFETEALMNHTRHCPDCSAMFVRLKSLSAELEALPKVTPSYSLVDSVLPELERIDQLNAQYEPVDTAPAAAAIGYSPRAKQRKRWTDRLSIRALGGVIAAGVVVGLFLVTYHPDSLKNADSSLAMESSTADSAADAGSRNSAAAGEPMAKKDASTLNAPKTSVGNESADKGIATNDKAADRPADDSPAAADGSGQPKADSGKAASEPDSPAPLDKNGTQQSTDPNTPQDKSAAIVPSQQGGVSSGQTFGAAAEGPDTGTAPDKATDQAGQEQRMGIAASPQGSNGTLSPNGAYNAVASDTKITIYDATAGGILYEKVKDGQVRIIAWSEDSSTLEYAVTAADASEKRFVIDVSKGTETEQP